MFTLEDLGSKSTQSNGSSKDCITDITGGWVCDAGNPHTPADCNSESNPNGKCNACGSEYVVKIEYGHCPDTEFDLNGSTGGVTVDLGEESDPNTPGGDEGGTNNSDVTETLPLTPCKNADETDINGNCFDEDKIDDSRLTGLAKCIYNKLTKSNSNLFKATIGKFIDDPEYNLTLTIGECTTSDDACTNTDNLATTGEIIIKIEDNSTNPLQMAQYILHEAIHAELYRFVSRYESGVDPNNRPRLFQLFKYYSELYNIGDIQHIYMTERYINPISSALRKLDGSKYPLDYYKAFAWDGLRVWDAGNLLIEDMDSKYEDYRKTVIENTTVSCD